MQEALSGAADAPGYPFTAGTPDLRQAVVSYLSRRVGVDIDEPDVLPTIGTKELVAGLPALLGLGPDDVVAIPRCAYPTYEVGALLAGCTVAVADTVEELEAASPTLVWINSPANPSGRVASVAELVAVVQWARQRGVIVVSDECYFELPWTAEPVSLLHPSVCGGEIEGLLVLHSLSKRSNMAGYRFGFVAGDRAIIARLLEVRKHSGMIVPAPVQAAAIAALGDDAHVVEQRARYGRRREVLREALVSSGFRVEHSEAGLYLWVTRDEPCWTTVDWLAERGILVAPGDFYGAAGERHVRIALTATDERVEQAAIRLASGTSGP